MSAIMITGYTGTRHIKPSMDAAVYRGAFGNENYVLNEDDACAGSMPSVNQFVVADGCVSMQGHAVQIKQVMDKAPLDAGLFVCIYVEKELGE